MIAIENNKGRQTKLLAAIAVFAMVACVFAMVAPADDVQGAETSVSDYDGLVEALNNATDGDTIVLSTGDYGSSENYVTITVDKSVTLKAAANATPVIYGSIVVKADDVVIDGLTINITYMMPSTERNAVNILSSSATVQNCTINMDADSTNLCNGVCIWPASGTQDYVIKNNTFNNLQDTEDWASVAILVAENLDLSSYANRFGEVSGTSNTLDMSMGEVFRMVSGNTYNDCSWKYSSTDYATEGAKTGLRVIGDFEGEYGQDMDYFSVEGTTYTLLTQASETLSLSFNSDEIFIVASGVEFDGDVSFTVNNVTSKVTLSNVIGGSSGLTFSAGSIEISGTMTGAEAQIKVENAQTTGAEVVLTGLNITSGTLTINGNVKVEGTVTIAEGATLALAEDAKIEIVEDAILNVGGSVTETTEDSIKNNGTVALISDDAIIPTITSGTGSIDTSGASSEAGLRGDLRTDTIFTEQQIVTVDGNLTLVAGTQLVIKGTLIIPEGITITIQEGAQLVIDGQAANVQNDGTIIILSLGESDTVGTPSAVNYDDGGLVIAGGNFVNNGTISAQYLKADTESVTETVIEIQVGATVDNNGTIIIGAESGLTINGIINNISGEVILNGTFNGTGSIDNKSTVTVNGALASNFSIKQTAADATVQVVSISGNYTLSVSTSIDKIGNVDVTGSAGVNINAQDSSKTISGITIKATTNRISNSVYNNAADISGNVVAGMASEWTGNNTIITLYGNINVTDSVTFGSNINVNLGHTNSGAVNLEVSGTMVISIFNSAYTGSEVTVTGLLQTYKDITTDNNLIVNAVKYITQPATANDKTVYNYTTLGAAVESGNTNIYVYGQISVDADVTVPNGMTVTQYAGTGNYGKITVDEDATLTFATGSRLIQSGFTSETGKYYGIDVDGTLYVEDARNTLRSTAYIFSQVRSSTGDDAMYTSLFNAMDAAVEGSDTVIELYNKAVSIDRMTFTIKSGVTVDTNGQNFTVNGSTLIIDGTLFIDGGAYDVVDDTTTTPGYTYEANVVLNGYIRSTSAFEYNGEEYPAGAYYAITTSGIPMYYATTVSNAAGVIGDVDDRTVYLCGTLSTGDVSFTGTASEPVFIVIDDGAVVTAGTITIDEARVTIGVDADATFVGTIASSEGSVTFARNTAITAGAYVQDATTEDEARLILVAVTSDTSGTHGNVTVDGTVYIGTASNICHLTVDGTAQVAASGVRASEITVNGILNVLTNSSLIAETIYVNGTLSTAVSTAETPGQGTVTVTNLYVGIERINGDLTQGSPADVMGNVSLTSTNGTVNGVAYVSNGSTIPESFFDYDNTEFYVEDALWMTAFGSKANVANAPVEDAKFLGWNDADGNQRYDDKTASSIDLDAYDALYAYINYNVYTVTINTDGGIASVAIDGIVVGGTGNTFTANGLTAGPHTVTYTLKNGYQGEAVLSSSDVSVSGLVFTLTGDFDTTYIISLSGTSPTDSVVVIDSGDSGMGLTDYLLIILVILIAVMAIIVAMRLMRS